MTAGGCVEHEAWEQWASGEKPSNSYLISSEDVRSSLHHHQRTVQAKSLAIGDHFDFHGIVDDFIEYVGA